MRCTCCASCGSEGGALGMARMLESGWTLCAARMPLISSLLERARARSNVRQRVPKIKKVVTTSRCYRSHQSYWLQCVSAGQSALAVQVRAQTSAPRHIDAPPKVSSQASVELHVAEH